MVKEITCYEDGSGKLHKSAFEAHRADLALWLAQCSAVNEASAKALADLITENRSEVAAMIAAIEHFAPIPDAAPLVMVA